MPLLDEIAAALEPHGLVPRGGFAFAPSEAAPPGPSGRPAKSVVLVGHLGGTPWPAFRAWRSRQPADLADPLDTWSRAVIGAVADRLGARAVSPADRPYLPFQAWAMRAEGLRPSPLGVLMHGQAGPWHAYRGALLFDTVLDLPAAPRMPHPCDGCREKPCLGACPVEAVAAESFDAAACRGHVADPATPCRTAGCRARNACPVGADHRYPADMQAFLMAAFAGGCED